MAGTFLEQVGPTLGLVRYHKPDFAHFLTITPRTCTGFCADPEPLPPCWTTDAITRLIPL